MRQIEGADYQHFITAAPIAVIHFDAEWDTRYREVTRIRMQQATKAFGLQAAFAEVDIDRSPELAKAIGVLNVPTVAYYRDGVLVAALIGSHQDVLARTERVMRGESIGLDDGLTGPATNS